MNAPTRGMTLIEVLVALAIFSVVIALSSAITTSLSINNGSRSGLSVNQAAQQYIEVMTDTWRAPMNFGVVNSTTPRPGTVAQYTWSATICEVDMGSAGYPCFTSAAQKVTLTPTSPATVTLTPSASATLMRLAVTYTPAGSGPTFSTSTELYRR